jgi:SAM-dependent methyltransferase
MALLDMFDTKELDAFAAALSADVDRGFPPSAEGADKAGASPQARAVLDLVRSRAATFRRQHKPGAYKRGKLASTFQGRLAQQGYGAAFVQRAVQELGGGLAEDSGPVPAGEDHIATEHACPVCGAQATLLDVVDFNKCCEEARGKFLPLAGTPVYYALCDGCGFCFAPALHRWPMDEFAARIYNDGYQAVDPDYVDARPRANARQLAEMFATRVPHIRHLDYGGGNGLMSRQLAGAGWDSASYDPFVDGPWRADRGRFNLVTSYEVFEHVPDVNHLINTLASLLEDDGMVLLSTLFTDGNVARGQRLQWWYASPRNGHISLFSRHSLALLAKKQGFELATFSPNLHALWRKVPAWTAGLFNPG